MWKLYVKWESNLILLRLAAHLVDGQKLTRGLAIYLIGHKIRVCISSFSMEPHSLVPLVPSDRNGGDAAGAAFIPGRAGRTQPECLERSAPAQLQHCRACRGCRGAAGVLQGCCCACPCQSHPPDKTPSVGAVPPASDTRATQELLQPHEQEHWCGSSNTTSKYGEDYVFY